MSEQKSLKIDICGFGTSIHFPSLISVSWFCFGKMPASHPRCPQGKHPASAPEGRVPQASHPLWQQQLAAGCVCDPIRGNETSADASGTKMAHFSYCVWGEKTGLAPTPIHKGTGFQKAANHLRGSKIQK